MAENYIEQGLDLKKRRGRPKIKTDQQLKEDADQKASLARVVAANGGPYRQSIPAISPTKRVNVDCCPDCAAGNHETCRVRGNSRVVSQNSNTGKKREEHCWCQHSLTADDAKKRERLIKRQDRERKFKQDTAAAQAWRISGKKKKPWNKAQYDKLP